MAGHSKWANIKHHKEKSDASKGKLISRIAKELISAVKQGGADIKTNAKLRLVLQKARSANVPNDVIERNLKKGSSADQGDYFEITYELYGYGGVGLVVDIMTDNKNRISSEMRIATNKRGGAVAEPGSVTFNFDRKGVIQVAKGKIAEEDLFMLISEAGAEDFEVEGDMYMIMTPVELLYQVKEALEKGGVSCDEVNLEMIPKHSVACDAEAREKNLSLIAWIEALDDVDTVYHNME